MLASSLAVEGQNVDRLGKRRYQANFGIIRSRMKCRIVIQNSLTSTFGKHFMPFFYSMYHLRVMHTNTTTLKDCYKIIRYKEYTHVLKVANVNVFLIV